MNGYEVFSVDNSRLDEWICLCKASKQYTPFIRDDLLSCVGYYNKKYLVKKNDTVVMGLCLAFDSATDEMAGIVPYAPHQGLLYQNSEGHKAYYENLEATMQCLKFIEGYYSKIEFANYYTVDDIRAILWHNYGIPENGKYGIEVKYTGIMSLEKDIYANMNKLRLRDYRKARKRGIQYQKSKNIAPFLELYRATFSREGISISENSVESASRIVSWGMETGHGFLRYAVTADGKYVGAVFILLGNDTAFYLFGANHPAYRSWGAGTFLLTEAIVESKELGYKKFDFVGINSPLRGDFKLSFGAVPKAYYICRWGGNVSG